MELEKLGEVVLDCCTQSDVACRGCLAPLTEGFCAPDELWPIYGRFLGPLAGRAAAGVDVLGRISEFDVLGRTLSVPKGIPSAGLCARGDVRMPVMDGLEATRRIRAGEAGEHARDIPIVAATAFAVRGDCEKCREAGMNGYVVKPMQSSDLLRAVAMYTCEDEELNCEVIVDDVKGSEMTIDIDAALKRLGGRRELFDKLAAKFMEDVPLKMDDLGQRIAEGDMDDVLRLAHGIKNSAGMIQANSMAEVALDMEMAVRENRLTEIPELFDNLRLVSDKALAAVKRCLEV